MSLFLPPSWNQPVLVATAGVVTAVLLPILEQQQQQSVFSLVSLQICQVAAYSLNVFATAQPGRLDGQLQQESLKNSGALKTENDDDTDPMVAALSTGRRGRSLLAPKGWAFIIWAPIFIGELVHVATSCILQQSSSSSSSSSAVALLQRTAPGFVMSQIFQSLWAASFRPKYKGYSSFISFAMLSGIAISLNGPHAAIAAHDFSQSGSLSYLLHGLPITLHFGWTTAASLVNLNGCFAMLENSSETLRTIVGHASVVAATTVGVAVTLARTAPVYGAVIGWALLACADGMADRCQSSSSSSQSSTKYDATRATRVQMWLCRVGAGIVVAASLSATFARLQQRQQS